MGEALAVAIPLAAGMMLGAMFYGGLWWTVSRGLASGNPALWFLGGRLLRTGLVLGGFYLVGGAAWRNWLWCLLGFVLARLAVWQMTRPPAPDPSARSLEGRDAP